MASFDQGVTFTDTAIVTDRPWDPAIDAPNSHGDPAVTFIGEYFGCDADGRAFDVLWTDTRTGVQELFFSRVETESLTRQRLWGVSPEKFWQASFRMAAACSL